MRKLGQANRLLQAFKFPHLRPLLLVLLLAVAGLAALPNIVSERSGLTFAKQRGGLPFIQDTHTITGNVFFVLSGGGIDSAGHGLHPDDPLASIDFANGLCTANQGDWIKAMPGHNEAVIAAGGLDLDVAGVTVEFMGHGTSRAKVTFSTDVGADMDIDAANITLINPRFVADIDALTGPIDVNAAGFRMFNYLYEDGTGIDTTDAIVADANADDMEIDGLVYRVGNGAGTQKQSHIQIAGATRPVLRNIQITGDFGTGAIENGTAWIDAVLENIFIDNAATGPVVGILLQATSTGKANKVLVRVASGVVPVTANNDMQWFDSWGVGVDAESAFPIGTEPFNVGTWPAAAVPADGVALTAVERANYNLLEVGEDIGEADIDISGPDYTSFQNLITIVPNATSPLRDVVIHFDLDKTTTGFVAVHTTSKTIQFAVARKIDGTNWRRDIDSLTTARAEDLSGLQGQTISIGDIGPDEEARIEVILSAEEGDTELPYSLYYRSNGINAPTITPVAA